MEYHVFISHSSKDKQIANTICESLEEAGIRCWISPRDMFPGKTWASEIMRGIKNANLVLLLYSCNANQSEHVTNEINVAFNSKKTIIPFLLDDSQMNEDFIYYLNRKHWLTAYPNYKSKLAELIQSVKQNLGADFVPYRKAETIETIEKPIEKQPIIKKEKPIEKKIEKPPIVKKEKTKLNKKVPIIVAVSMLLVVLAMIIIITSKGKNDKVAEEPATSIDSTAIEPLDTAIKTKMLPKVPQTEKPSTQPPDIQDNKPTTTPTAEPQQGTLVIAGNIYEGSLYEGKPHGKGVLKFTASTLISPHDHAKTMAEEGDYLTGSWYKGELELGTLYDKNNEKKSVIRIGRQK